MKRLISLVLSLCMIIGFLPAVTVSAENSGYTIVYDMVEGSGYKFTRPYDMKSVKYADTNHLWEFRGTNSSKTVNVNAAYGLQAATQVGEWIALEVNIPVGGDYSLEFTHGIAKSEGAVAGGMWILPADTEDIGAALVTDSALATDICYHNSTQSKSVVLNTRNFGPISLSAGKHIVVYKSITGDSRNKGTMYPGKLTFKSGDGSGTVLAAMKGSLSKDSIDPEGISTDKIEMTYYMSNGEKSTGDYELSYKSDDESVATVSAEGVVTAVNYGTATVTVTAKNEVGYEISADVAVEVKKQGYTISYDIAAGLTEIGAVFENSTFSGERVLFKALNYKLSDGFYEYRDSYGAKADGGTNSAYLNYRTGSIQVAEDRWIAFEVFVPAPGTYTMEMYNATYKTYGNIDVYLSQDKASTDSKDKIGYYECDSKVTSNTFPLVTTPNKIEDIEIPQRGYYIFTFKADANYGFVGSFNLTNGTGLSALMSVSVDGVESGLATVSGIMSDGIAADLTDAKIEWESSDPNVAEINENGFITEKNIGETTITAKVTLDGFTSTASTVLKVTVQPEPPLEFSGVYEEYNFFDVSQDWVQGSGANNLKTDVCNITYKYTNETGNGNWQWFGTNFTPGANTAWAYRSNGQVKPDYRLRLEVLKDDWAALTIKVPKAGRYAVTYEYATFNPSAGISEIYILPMMNIEDVDAALTKRALAGTVDYLAGEANVLNKASKSLGIREFETEGEYLLVFKQTSDRGKSGYITPRKLYLDGVNTLKFVTSDVDKTELNYMEKATMQVEAKKLDGTVLTDSECSIIFASSDDTIATVNEKGVITAIGDGIATITATVSDGNATYQTSVDVTANDNTGIKEVMFKAPDNLYVREKAKLSLVVKMNSGNLITVPAKLIAYSSSNTGICEIDENGMINGISVGNITLSAAAEFKGEKIEVSKDISVSAHEGKSEPTYYTIEKRELALENIKNYDWAKELKTQTVTRAERRTEDYQLIYDLIPGEGIPRARQVGAPDDPDYCICRYCGGRYCCKIWYTQSCGI